MACTLCDPERWSCVRRLCWFCVCVWSEHIECNAKVLTYLCLSTWRFASLFASLTLQGSRALPDPCSHQRSGDSQHACDVTAMAQVPAECRDDTSFSSLFFSPPEMAAGMSDCQRKTRLVEGGNCGKCSWRSETAEKSSSWPWLGLTAVGKGEWSKCCLLLTRYKVGHGCTLALCTLNLHFCTAGSRKARSGDQKNEVNWPREQQQHLTSVGKASDSFCRIVRGASTQLWHFNSFQSLKFLWIFNSFQHFNVTQCLSFDWHFKPFQVLVYTLELLLISF